ncbi:MAG: IclR family transcriptional regulator [Nitrososphaera sp.]|nr:IclR family transcriptional regulator [Nitrososphaera sp.]
MTSLVPAIDRAIQMLYLFKDGSEKEYGVSEISRLLELNKSTAHNILNTLAYHNFLVQNETTRRYRLGPALAELGSLVRSRIDLRAVARPTMRRLVEQSGATILLGIFDEATITIIDKEEPLTDLRVAASIGMQIPFCAGSFGKAFLAYFPEEVVDRLLADPGLQPFTPTAATDPGQYKAALAVVREQGYAVDNNEEYLQDVGAISAPIFTPGAVMLAAGREHGPEVAAVMTLVNFSSRLPPEEIGTFTSWVVEAARSISEALGMPAGKQR